MTDRVKQRKEFVLSREYKKFRSTQEVTWDGYKNCKTMMEAERDFCLEILSQDHPQFFGDDIFGFNRYVVKVQSRRQMRDYLSNTPLACECNLVIDYETFLKEGFNGIKNKIAKFDGKSEFLEHLSILLEKVESMVDEHRLLAKKEERWQVYEALKVVPMNGANDYYQALVSIKALLYFMRAVDTPHMPLGRFDVYMRPYYEKSKQSGATREQLLELTELFFLALNIDADTYRGVQQGDNGQSLVLGGMGKDGKDVFCELSEVCLQASEELAVIDPKINVRVNKNTPLEFYERCTRLTKQGLGFPQYNNDDVVIEGLKSLGYDEEDAIDYAVAACWEFIPSYVGADIPNKGNMNFPLAVDVALKNDLIGCESFDEFLECVKTRIAEQQQQRRQIYNQTKRWPFFFVSMMVRGCVEKGLELSENGAKYRNYGVHGVGISDATDSLMAIKKCVFENASITKQNLIDAIEANFEGYEDERKMLASNEKMGNNDDEVDAIAIEIMNAFAECTNNVKNNVGGIYRAGTGSAMEYLWSAHELGARPNGKKAKEAFGCSYSPAINSKINGPISAVLSFTKPDLRKTINGGPFTIEIHDTVFRNEEGEKKVAMMVKAFIDRGGHQMQINSLNADTLRDAQINPENYRNLIVRVWGWSGYFVELDKPFQDHVISRTEFKF